MARSPASIPAKPKPAAASPAGSGLQPDLTPREGYRETVEAIVVAFILALLVRGFAAEAFVIPTGSMAPTLMGRHKEVTCPECGYVYSVNASEEVEGIGAGNATGRRVHTGICVNCRYQARVDGEPSFKGDRILVMKFPYDLPFLPGASEPKRWDVVVFRYPEDPEVSYIKRLVGLPGETLRIWYGDVFIKPPGGKEFRQAHKPLEHQQAMQMMVYDDRHRPHAFNERLEWRRWVSASPGAWAEDPRADVPGSYVATPSGSDWAELRYHHLIPEPGQWKTIEAGDALARGPRPTLITDFYSYNTNLNVDNSDLTEESASVHDHFWKNAWLQPHWVGDLTLSSRISSSEPAGVVRFELIEGGVSNRCEIDLESGEAVLTHGDAELGRKLTRVIGSGVHDVVFSNVDNRLTLLIDGQAVFGEGLSYLDPPGEHPVPTNADLVPVRVAVKGVKLRLSDLVLKRDIYYTLDPGEPDYGSRVWDTRIPRTPGALFDLLADPEQVAALGPLGTKEYKIGARRFMMLGDNSPRSKDSRGWERKDLYWDDSGREAWEVPRAMITGKAFCVYWPHGKPIGPNIRVNQDFRIPFRPYFERMKWIY